MKSGTCPKCKSEEVYCDDGAKHWRPQIVVGVATSLQTHLYICRTCGYCEWYAVTGHDLSRVKEKYRKVKTASDS